MHTHTHSNYLYFARVLQSGIIVLCADNTLVAPPGFADVGGAADNGNMETAGVRTQDRCKTAATFVVPAMSLKSCRMQQLSVVLSEGQQQRQVSVLTELHSSRCFQCG